MMMTSTEGNGIEVFRNIAETGRAVFFVAKKRQFQLDNWELKHARFWDANGNLERTFRVLGPYCLPDFYTTQH